MPFTETLVVVVKFFCTGFSAVAGIAALFGTFARPKADDPGSLRLTRSGTVLAAGFLVAGFGGAFTSWWESENNARAAVETQKLMERSVANSADAVRAAERIFYPLEEIAIWISFEIDFPDIADSLPRIIRRGYDALKSVREENLPYAALERPDICGLNISNAFDSGKSITAGNLLRIYAMPNAFGVMIWRKEDFPRTSPEGQATFILDQIWNRRPTAIVSGPAQVPERDYPESDGSISNRLFGCPYEFSDRENRLLVHYKLKLPASEMWRLNGKASATDLSEGIMAILSTNASMSEEDFGTGVPEGHRGRLSVTKASMSTYDGYAVDLPADRWRSLDLKATDGTMAFVTDIPKEVARPTR